jgi:hypothetical protein
VCEREKDGAVEVHMEFPDVGDKSVALAWSMTRWKSEISASQPWSASFEVSIDLLT